MFVKVRSTRPPRAGVAERGRDGVEVELADGEEGVAPGQACVFYDSAEGGARMLGGGFIRGAQPAETAADANRLRRTPDRVSSARSKRGEWRIVLIGARSKRRMRAGRRSTTSCSARCSSAAAGPRSQAAERVGGRILEVGVGTGISLPDYARSNRLVGIDISAPMLRKAKERVDTLGLSNVEALAVMDAKHLAFPDDSFDVIVAQYVITAVPDPEATLDEFARVLKPGGEIVLVNHIGAESGARKAFELAFAPVARRLGWRPEFPWGRLTAWKERMPSASISSSARRCRRSAIFR